MRSSVLNLNLFIDPELIQYWIAQHIQGDLNYYSPMFLYWLRCQTLTTIVHRVQLNILFTESLTSRLHAEVGYGGDVLNYCLKESCFETYWTFGSEDQPQMHVNYYNNYRRTGNKTSPFFTYKWQQGSIDGTYFFDDDRAMQIFHHAFPPKFIVSDSPTL